MVEKPGGTDSDLIKKSSILAEKNSTQVFVAYNRRYYESVRKASKIIQEDGGVTSFIFEFTEWSDTISQLDIPEQIKNSWFLHNSTHVIDMAFFLCGDPVEIATFRSGSLDWHPIGSAFTGAGKTETGALFSYAANWNAPGRWSLEVLTSKRRLIFRPLEELKCQKRGSVSIEEIFLEDHLDQEYKPGLYRQVRSFLDNEGECAITLPDQVKLLEIYQKICPT